MCIDGARMDLEGILDDCHDRRHCGKGKYDTKQKQNDILWLGEIRLDLVQNNHHLACFFCGTLIHG